MEDIYILTARMLYNLYVRSVIKVYVTSAVTTAEVRQNCKRAINMEILLPECPWGKNIAEIERSNPKIELVVESFTMHSSTQANEGFWKQNAEWYWSRQVGYY